MSESSIGRLGQPEVMVILDWRDGPLEGILRRRGGNVGWYFKLFAERLETSVLDDRLFALWEIPDSDSATLCEEFGEIGRGVQVWPVTGGLGSIEARRIVDGILAVKPGLPNLIVRTTDFAEILGVWEVVPD
ncbi:hypothetical protein [Streptomyces sp. NPDC096324]|uniref:hypothetical protein n=1 Tax=Streptomyces sp. NPDC096324 TaxID=3366085 RepID=UPI0038183FB2